MVDIAQDASTVDSPPVVLRVRGLNKSFGKAAVLKGIDLDVHRGETVAVIGTSGTGKSTLLRCVNQLVEHTAGTIEIDGIVVGSPDPKAGRAARRARSMCVSDLRKSTGMVFQHYNLWPHLSVLENVTTGPVHVLGKNTEEAKKRAVECLEMVRMDDLRARYPGQLSGGQQQRVAIARALAMDPRVMLFDEVTSALDPQLVGEVLDVMTTVAQEGMTMLVVTHEMGFARHVADTVIFMDEGQIVEQGPPIEVLENPTHTSTQQFLEHSRRRAWGQA